MTVDRYLPARSPRSVMLLVTIALHAAIVAALFMFNADVRTTVTNVFKTIPITPDAPPPPIPPKIDRKVMPKTDPRPIDRPIPQTPIRPDAGPLIDPVPADPWVRPEPFPPTPTADPVPQIKPAAPVLTAASNDPRYARDLQPPYPLALQRAEQEGQVTVRVHIGPDGRVIEIVEVRADAEGFFAATRDWALRKWRFKPATRDGEPVASWRTMTVTFKLH